MAVSPLGDRVFVGGNPKELYVFEIEPGTCSEMPGGLTNFYPLDGSFDDAREKAHLTAAGEAQFVPGKVGQAVRLTNGGTLEASVMTHYRFGRSNSTLAFWMKTAPGVRDGATLFERKTPKGDAGWAVRLGADGRLTFRIAADDGTGGAVTSTGALNPGRWHHVAITKDDRHLRLFVDDEPEGQGAAPAGAFVRTQYIPIRIGGAQTKAFDGWLDEIAYFDRALGDGEIRTMYRRRAEGPCAGAIP